MRDEGRGVRLWIWWNVTVGRGTGEVSFRVFLLLESAFLLPMAEVVTKPASAVSAGRALIGGCESGIAITTIAIAVATIATAGTATAATAAKSSSSPTARRIRTRALLAPEVSCGRRRGLVQTTGLAEKGLIVMATFASVETFETVFESA